jgi:endonuclease-8
MLRGALEGAVVTGFEAPRARRTTAAPEPGDRAERVEARGKHLLIRFAGGATLHTHMRMTGTWRAFPVDRSWRADGGRVVAVVRTKRAVAVCFAAPVVELLDDRAVRRHPVLSTLGPDLCLPDPDLDEIGRRSEGLDPQTEVGVALLDQRVAAGIGNVYKSEVAFACRVDPFAPIALIDRDRRADLWRTASELLRRNLGPSPRRTTPHGLAVYDRAGHPCRTCGTPIAVRRQGEAARATWWCPTCQPPTPATRDGSVTAETVG